MHMFQCNHLVSISNWFRCTVLNSESANSSMLELIFIQQVAILLVMCSLVANSPKRGSDFVH